MHNTLSLSGYVICTLFLITGCQTSSVSQKDPSPPREVFGWPFLSPETMRSRGGITTGSSVVLSTDSSNEWQRLQSAHGLSDFKRDRLAILALQGSYRASFQFIEAAGFSDNYSPSQPYFSWGTEHIHLLEDSGDFISLQHTLVMYFKQEDGKVSEPMVMKHWRQDWHYQDQQIHAYIGHNTWQRQRVSTDAVQGTWSQAVYHVDDSPRYQVLGRWHHQPNYSSWQSQISARPLPRREWSVRDDYNLLTGQHRLTLTPNGWIHLQQNEKALQQASSESIEQILAIEIGINRYERITQPKVAIPAHQYWEKTNTYWQAVRHTWQQIFAKRDTVKLKDQYDDKTQYQYHFDNAEQLSKVAHTKKQAQQHAEKTIQQFLID